MKNMINIIKQSNQNPIKLVGPDLRYFSKDPTKLGKDTKIHTARIQIPKDIHVERLEKFLIFQSSLGSTTLQLEKIDKNGDCLINIIPANQITIHTCSFPLLGLLKKLFENKLVGVSRGYIIYLQLVGVGYRVSLQDDTLYFKLGHSHDITYQLPSGLRVMSQTSNSLCFFGIDKNQLTQIVASIKRLRPPEAYKGKGIRYLNEKLKIKSGKRK